MDLHYGFRREYRKRRMARLRSLGKPTQDQGDRLVLIEQGKHAQLAIGYTDQVIFHLEEVILGKLVNKHRAGTLTEADMRGGIGEIAGLRNLVHALKGDMQKARIAQDEEMKGGN